MEHIPAPPPTLSAGISCVPSSGTVPFPVLMSVTLGNDTPDQTRRIAARLELTLANGQSFAPWRSGYANVQAGEAFQTGWVTSIPARGSVIGENQVVLLAEDVTPFPWNQPPYPPAGGTDGGLCSIEGMAP
jgi:hypothetical protein